PEPAPAITAIGPSGAPITAACSAVGSAAPSSRASWAGLYCVAGPAPPGAPAAPPRLPGPPVTGPPPEPARIGPFSARRSRAHLPAPFVHRAAGGDRADPAAGVRRGLEHRAGHPGGHRLHQFLRPARLRVAGQRAL